MQVYRFPKFSGTSNWERERERERVASLCRNQCMILCVNKVCTVPAMLIQMMLETVCSLHQYLSEEHGLWSTGCGWFRVRDHAHISVSVVCSMNYRIFLNCDPGLTDIHTNWVWIFVRSTGPIAPEAPAIPVGEYGQIQEHLQLQRKTPPKTVRIPEAVGPINQTPSKALREISSCIWRAPYVCEWCEGTLCLQEASYTY